MRDRPLWTWMDVSHVGVSTYAAHYVIDQDSVLDSVSSSIVLTGLILAPGGRRGWCDMPR